MSIMIYRINFIGNIEVITIWITIFAYWSSYKAPVYV